jgi:hypothetical protein
MKKSKGHSIYFEVDYALNTCKQNEKKLRDSMTTIITWKAGRSGKDNVSKATMEAKNAEIAKLDESIQVMKKAQIIIYAILSHFDKAVKIALECGDVNMAKAYANKPEDKKLKKKLWMKIAKYLFNYQGKKEKTKQDGSQGGMFSTGPETVTKQKYANKEKYSISQAIEILNPKESKLKIDDLLPLFPPGEKV